MIATGPDTRGPEPVFYFYYAISGAIGRIHNKADWNCSCQSTRFRNARLKMLANRSPTTRIQLHRPSD